VNYAYLKQEGNDFTIMKINPGENILKEIMKQEFKDGKIEFIDEDKTPKTKDKGRFISPKERRTQ